MIVRAMLEVCSREEEYERLKDISTRISGLPYNFMLARRERRIVAQGLLRRVHLSDQERAILEGEEPGAEDPQEIPLCMPILSPQYRDMRGWDTPPPATTSWLKSSSLSFGSSQQDTRPLSMLSSSSFTSSIAMDMDDDHSRARTNRNAPSSNARSFKPKSKDSLVYVFVFTDLVLFTHRTEARDEYEKDSWYLVDDIGMSRVLGVTDQSGKVGMCKSITFYREIVYVAPDYDQLLCLDVLPMPQEQGGVNVAPTDCMAYPVYLSLSERATVRSTPARLLEEAKQQWMQAFHKCFMFTLRSLSFPCQTGMDLAHGPTADYEMDTKMSVMSILSSGLPLPKSPSQLLDEFDKGRPSDATEEEREERGWWAVRFRQVLREMQRQDLQLPSQQPQVEAPHVSKRTRTTSGPVVDNRRRSVMASRPLLLSASSPSSILLTPATPRKEKSGGSPNPSNPSSATRRG